MSTSSTISSFLKRLASARCLNRQPKLLLLPTISDSRSYSARSYPRNNLFSRISPLGNPDIRVTPILDKWVEEGKKVRDMELKHIIRDLRKRRRFTQALEVSEWLGGRENFEVSDSDHAVQLDLIGRVHGIDAAERYFNKVVDGNAKSEKLYGALLNCYVREGLVEKSMSHLQLMKEKEIPLSRLTYNDIMCLYTNIGQHEKVADVLKEMKDNGVSPDCFSYRICINSYGVKSDIESMEKVVKEMEEDPYISMDWNTYANASNYFIKAGLKEKALAYLKKAEEKVSTDILGFNHLISLYAHLESKSEMMRLWGLQKKVCKRQLNREYITMLGCLVKLNEFEEAENLLTEWESNCQSYDFRVPNILLIGYCQRGMIEKAEAKLRAIIRKGKTPTPNSWAILAAEYINLENMDKALKCIKEALAVEEENKGWRPKPNVITTLLSWLGDNGTVEDVEDFVNALKVKVPAEKEMNDAIAKAHLRIGKNFDGLLIDPVKPEPL
ncbi:hypothetical protein QQ045_026850 [Rhodiola kirilowii]